MVGTLAIVKDIPAVFAGPAKAELSSFGAFEQRTNEPVMCGNIDQNLWLQSHELGATSSKLLPKIRTIRSPYRWNLSASQLATIYHMCYCMLTLPATLVNLQPGQGSKKKAR